MARNNAQAGASSAAVGQHYSTAVLSPAAQDTDPWTLHFVYKRSGGWDSGNQINWIDVADGASTSSGRILLYETTGGATWEQRIHLRLYDDGGGGWSHYAEAEFRYSAGGSTIAQPADSDLVHFTVTFGTGTTATDITNSSELQGAWIDGVKMYQHSWTEVSHGAPAHGNPECAAQVLGAGTTGNNAFLGDWYTVAAWNRALSDGEIVSLSKGYSPAHFPHRLNLYHSQIRTMTSAEVIPDGCTITDTYGAQAAHDYALIDVPRPIFFGPVFAAVDLAVGVADAVTEFGPAIELGNVLAVGVADAVTEFGPAFEVGYSSPLLQIRDALAVSIEALSTPDLSGNLYVHAGDLFRLPEGAQGHRMFLFELPAGGTLTEMGTTHHQVEHTFSLRCRYASSTDAAGDVFASLVSEAVSIMRAIDNTSLASIIGADIVITEGYRTEPAPNDDTDIVVDLTARTQETS